MQGVGQLLCAIVLIIVTHSGLDADLQWRVAVAFGAVPMVVAFYFRWEMHETSAFAEEKLAKTGGITFDPAFEL
jgi:hypothetical protein